MTQQEVPQLESFASCLARVPPERHDHVMKEATKKAWGRFDKRLDSRLAAMGFMNGKPEERWRLYTEVITPAMWGELQIKYPERYRRMKADFDRLGLRYAKEMASVA